MDDTTSAQLWILASIILIIALVWSVAWAVRARARAARIFVEALTTNKTDEEILTGK